MPTTKTTISALKPDSTIVGISLRRYCRCEIKPQRHVWSEQRSMNCVPNQANSTYGLTYVSRNPRSKICVSTYVRETRTVVWNAFGVNTAAFQSNLEADELGTHDPRISRQIGFNENGTANSNVTIGLIRCYDLNTVPLPRNL
jgi:hypothetical protein